MCVVIGAELSVSDSMGVSVVVDVLVTSDSSDQQDIS